MWKSIYASGNYSEQTLACAEKKTAEQKCACVKEKTGIVANAIHGHVRLQRNVLIHMTACVGANIHTGACSHTPAAKTGTIRPYKRTVAALSVLDDPQVPVLLAPVYPAFLGPPVTNLACLWIFLLPDSWF